MYSLRSQLGVVPQEPFLFAGTIGDNIAFARPNATDAEIHEAVDKVGLTDVIERMPNGLDTVVHERGQTLSSGERQLIALARAFLAHPRVLVLDEATSNLDLQSETKIESALDVLLENRTAILIAHRLSTAMRADRIVVVDLGRIIEVGTPRRAGGGRRAVRRDVRHLGAPVRPVRARGPRRAVGLSATARQPLGDGRAGTPSADRDRVAGHAGPAGGGPVRSGPPRRRPRRRPWPCPLPRSEPPAMHIGVVLPQTEIGPDVGGVRAYGQGVDELGFHHLVAYDHVVGADPAVHVGLGRSLRHRHPVPRAVRGVRLPGRLHLARAGHRHHHPPPAPHRPGGQAGGRGGSAHRGPVPPGGGHRMERRGVRRRWDRTSRPGAGASRSRSDCCGPCGPPGR